MEVIPLQNVGLGSTGKPAVDLSVCEPDGDLVLSIERMEVRGIVFSVEHRNHDSEEAAKLRHPSILRAVSVSMGPLLNAA
jgi:hypothetical protein